jgi:hypothetical protein
MAMNPVNALLALSLVIGIVRVSYATEARSQLHGLVTVAVVLAAGSLLVLHSAWIALGVLVVGFALISVFLEASVEEEGSA